MPGEAQPISEFVEVCKRLSVTDFCDGSTFAYLVRHGANTALRAPDGPQRTWSAASAAAVEQVKKAGARPSATDFTIYTVGPTGRSSGGFITVGRTRNNDVVILDVSLSKFHASLRAADGKIEIQDAGSRNGTFVNDEQVAAVRGTKRVILETGDQIRFGTVEVTFLYPADFHAMVRRLF